jgi:metallo-beta-lactamase family protein
MSVPATLTFLGGAGTVTGSKHLLRWNGLSVLLDCGLFQGLKTLRLRNWAPLPELGAKPDAVVLSHAHLDHSGYLPLLTRNGFSGPVYCTPGTADLLGPMLLDSAHIQEEDAARANRYRYTKHAPALPLYTTEDARRALALLAPRAYGDPFSIAPGIEVTLRRAGHILGSATVDVALGAGGSRPQRVVFSGDLGRWDRPIIRDPEPVPEADVLLIEGTYGDRDHALGSDAELARIVTETAHRGGALIVPSFAIGRTQELIWTIRKLEEARRIPLVSVYIDSPLATNVTELYCRHPEDHDLEMTALMDEKRCPLCCRQYNVVRSVDESKRLNSMTGPLIVIAGSGMATGGRVLHHLKRRLPDHRNTVLLVGYQAAGTRGRALHEGVREVKIHGEMIPVRARVEVVGGLSAHADRGEILRWLRGFRRSPRQTYVVHAELGPATALAASIRTELGWPVLVARDSETVAVDNLAGESPRARDAEPVP